MITSFQGEHRFLSNFSPCNVEFEGMVFPTVEHAYQAAKTLDLSLRQQIAALPTPGKAKRFGRQLELRPDWDRLRVSIMLQLLISKFTHEPWRGLLIATRDEELIEGNTWGDRFWGAELVNGVWVGENKLGRSLMLVRETLLEAK